MNRSALAFILLLALTAAASAHNPSATASHKYGALLLCENAPPKFVTSPSPLRAFRGKRCARRVVAGKADAKAVNDHAQLWPFRGESFNNFKSLKELQFACYYGSYVTLVKRYTTLLGRRRWRKVHECDPNTEAVVIFYHVN